MERSTRYKGVALYRNGRIWYYRYWINGKEFKGSLKTTKLVEAKASLDSGLIDKVKRSRLGIVDRKDGIRGVTVKQSIDDFLTDVWSKKEQRIEYKGNVERVVKEFGKMVGFSTLLSEIGVPEKRKYMQFLRREKSHLSAGGFNHKLKLLRIWDKWCVENHNLERDMLYINKKDMRENNVHLERYISEDDYHKVCANVDHEWLIPYFRFGYYLGLRREEIVKMQLRDDGKLWIYGKRGMVRKLQLPKALFDDYAKIEAHREGKSIQSLCDEISRGWCRSAKKSKVYLPCGCGFGDWSQYKRGDLCPNCRQPFHPLGNGKTFHGTRHSFVTRSLERGVSQVVVSKLVGHRNLSTTEKYQSWSDDYILNKLSSKKADGLVDDQTKEWYQSIGLGTKN